MTVTETQLSWIGGVLDQKGNINRKKNKMRATPQMVLYVESRHIEVVRKLGTLTGTVTPTMPEQAVREWNRRACAEHCENKYHVHIRQASEGQVESFEPIMPPVARWQATGSGAAIILHNVMPYMQTDRGFKEFYWDIIRNTVSEGQGFAAVFRSANRLRELGWELPSQYETFFKDWLWVQQYVQFLMRI